MNKGLDMYKDTECRTYLSNALESNIFHQAILQNIIVSPILEDTWTLKEKLTARWSKIIFGPRTPFPGKCDLFNENLVDPNKIAIQCVSKQLMSLARQRQTTGYE
jgi:hypothetical protein